MKNIEMKDIRFSVIKHEEAYGYGYYFEIGVTATINGHTVHATKYYDERDVGRKTMAHYKKELLMNLFTEAMGSLNMDCPVSQGRVAL